MKTTSRRPAPPHHACTHQPHCPSAQAPDHDAASILTTHPKQGWSLLCNGIVTFDDTGELLPDGRSVTPHRPTDARHN